MPRPTPRGRSAGGARKTSGAKSSKSTSKSTRTGKGPKSTHADGSAKQRWTPEQRAARGMSPRRGGGRPRGRYEGDQPRDERHQGGDDRGERAARPDYRDSRDFRDSRDERRSHDRDDRSRGGYAGRDERPGADRYQDRQEDRRAEGSWDRAGGRSFDRDVRGSFGDRRQAWNDDRDTGRGGWRDDRRDDRRDDPRDDRRGGWQGGSQDRQADARGGRARGFVDKVMGRHDRSRDDRDQGRQGGWRDSRRDDRRDDRRSDRRSDTDGWSRRPSQPRDVEPRGSWQGDSRRDDARDRDGRHDMRAGDSRRDGRDRDDRRDVRTTGERPHRSSERPFRPARPVRESASAPHDDWRRERARREEREFGRRPDRFSAQGDLADEDRSYEDTMDWQAPDAGQFAEVDASGVDTHEGFAALGVPPVIVASLAAQGITSPFPIQQATIPDAIAGRDVLGRGQTGSGKTLGFGLPLLARVAESDPTGGAVRALVLEPTRELALQVADVLAPLARTLGLDLALVAGGMSYGPQLKAFERGVDIVVATPGRLIDLMEQGAVDLSRTLVTVLDEADHMADLGFLPAVTTILDQVPADGQRLLFSATLDHAVDRIVRRYLHDPITHEVDTPRASVSTMEHVVLLVQPHDKNAITAEIANREGRTVVFARTQLGASRIADQLREAGVMAGALHGGLTQGARSRMLQAFRDGTVPVLVATDVAARGIHVDDVSLVLQVDPPMNSKDYLHRAGRTARAGEKGVVTTIMLPHQRKSVGRLLGDAGVRHTPVPTKPGDEHLAEATGARPATEPPIETATFEALVAPKKPVARHRGASGGGPRGGRGFGERSGGRGHGSDRGDRGGRGERFDRGGYGGGRGETGGSRGGWSRQNRQDRDGSDAGRADSWRRTRD